jgi:hypothetical protein
MVVASVFVFEAMPYLSVVFDLLCSLILLDADDERTDVVTGSIVVLLVCPCFQQKRKKEYGKSPVQLWKRQYDANAIDIHYTPSHKGKVPESQQRQYTFFPFSISSIVATFGLSRSIFRLILPSPSIASYSLAARRVWTLLLGATVKAAA